MTRRLLGLVGIMFVGLVAIPRQGFASAGDVIWGMSGPQLVGAVVECRVGLTGDYRWCDFLPSDPRTKLPRTWISFDGGVYVSTGKNAEGTDYEAGHTRMLAFEPMFALRSTPDGSRFVVYHAAGITDDLLFGTDFDHFTKVGFKVRVVGVAIGHWNFSYNLRLYPNGFTAGDFGAAPPTIQSDRPFEIVRGFTIGWSR